MKLHGSVVAPAKRIADFRRAVVGELFASAIAIWRGRATSEIDA